MQMNLMKFRLCPKCGSTDFLENHNSPGVTTCVDCSNRIIEISLTEMREDDIPEQNCSHCNAEGEEDDTLFDNGSVIVYKCKKCGKIDGYFAI